MPPVDAICCLPYLSAGFARKSRRLNSELKGRQEKPVEKDPMRIKAVIPCGMLAIGSVAAPAQDMMQHVDLASPEMTDVEAAIAGASSTRPVDLTGRRLSGIDLSGLDLSAAVLRSAKLNKTKLAGAKLDIRPGLGGAAPIGVTIIGTDFRAADLASARLIVPIGLEAARNFDQARNLDRLRRE
jgi:hypothetical protein